jgi:hypothetical protein
VPDSGLLKLPKSKILKEVNARANAVTEVSAAGLEKALLGIRVVY